MDEDNKRDICEYYSVIKKEILPFVKTWMYLEGMKDKYHLIFLTYGI